MFWSWRQLVWLAGSKDKHEKGISGLGMEAQPCNPSTLTGQGGRIIWGLYFKKGVSRPSGYLQGEMEFIKWTGINVFQWPLLLSNFTDASNLQKNWNTLPQTYIWTMTRGIEENKHRNVVKAEGIKAQTLHKEISTV